MDRDRPAPGRLEVVRHVLNSDDRRRRTDRADDVESLDPYLAQVGLGPLVRDADLARFRAFRDATRHLLLQPTAAARATFDEIARSYPMTIAVGEDPPRLLRSQGAAPAPLDDLVAEALEAVHAAMLTGQWLRLRACRRFDCSWIFYDDSRGTAMRWCSSDPCGNVMKTRAFRARRSRQGQP